MPYDFFWHDPDHSIIRVEIAGDVTWLQWHSTVDTIVEALAQTPETRIDVIFNDNVGLPKGNPIANLIWTAEKFEKYPNLGLTVTVSPPNTPKFVKAVIEMIGHAYTFRSDYYGGFVDTFDQALDVIAKDRANRVVPKP